MSAKKILVIYFSRTGHTKEIAKKIASYIGCDAVEIFSVHPYKLGVWGFQKGFLHSLFKILPEIQISPLNISKFDLVIIGTPVWAGSLSAPVRTFMRDYRAKIRHVALFSTQGGVSGRERLAEQLKEIYGREPIAYMGLSEADLEKKTVELKIVNFVRDLNLPTKKERPHPESAAEHHIS